MREALTEAIKILGLTTEQVRILRLNQYESILNRILNTFTTLGRQGDNHLWLWENFKGQTSSISRDEFQTSEQIMSLFDGYERAWFIAEDWDKKIHGNFWIFEGEIKSLIRLIDEVHPFEYYIVDKDFHWLICENHHDTFIGMGDPVVDRIRKIRAERQS